jgi:hypothetical protein
VNQESKDLLDPKESKEMLDKLDFKVTKVLLDLLDPKESKEM